MDEVEDEDGVFSPLDAAQLYQTLLLLGGGGRDRPVAQTVQRIIQTHGASSLVQVLAQFAPLFLAADAETRELYARATAGEGDVTSLSALLERFKPLLEQSSASLFDADEDAGSAAQPRELGAAEEEADGGEGEDTFVDGEDGTDADGFADAQQDGTAYRMHELVWDGDIGALRAYLLRFPSEMHMLDPRGNTPAHVAVLRHSLAAMQLLLEAGYDVSVKSSSGWTVLEDSLAMADVGLVRLLLAASHEHQLKLWRVKKPIVLQAMHAMPDFRMQLSWEFGSPVFSGLVKQLAPYDEYQIYKVGTKLRVDASIVGFEGMRWVRGKVSLRFDGSQSEGELSIVNHEERKIFVKEAGTFASREGDSLEAEADFLLGTEIVQVNVRTSNTTFEPVKQRLRSGLKTEQVGQWLTTIYAASSDLTIERKSKTGRIRPLSPTFEQYVNNSLDADAQGGRQLARRFGRKRQQSDEEEVQVMHKKATGRANMVAGFPISTEQLVSLLEMVAPLNREIAKARSFMETQVPPGLFPVKMKVPVTMGVHLQIAFPEFELVHEDQPEWWEVPASYEKRSMVEQLQALGDKIEKIVAANEETAKAGGRANGERVPIDGIGDRGLQD